VHDHVEKYGSGQLKSKYLWNLILQPVIKRCFRISIQLSTVKENQAYPDSLSFWA
jgi:hypothetical protein